MRKIINCMMICVTMIMLLLPLTVTAQEVSSPNSRWWVRVYNDVNNNNEPDNGEEVTGTDVKWGAVDGVTCSSVPDDTNFNHLATYQSPFFTAAGLGCHFYLIGSGILTVTNYSAKRASIDSQSIVPDVWIRLDNLQYMPIVIRAWSGQ